MQLWTHQPTGFQIDSASLVIDPARGQYWSCQIVGSRYRDVLPKLQELVGASQFLWCCTVPGQFVRVTEQMDLVEWELNVPESQILRCIRASVWEAIVRGESDDWENLFRVGAPVAGIDIHVLVRVPLPAGTARSHGQLRPLYTRERLEHLKDVTERSRNLPAHEREPYDW